MREFKINEFLSLKLENESTGIYVNGELLQATTGITGTLVQGSATYYIGSIGGGGEFFEGKYASFKMYNRGLTAEEVAQNYNAQKQKFQF